MDHSSFITSPNEYFEGIKKIDDNGIEYWEARELMRHLQYTKWSNFENVIEKAKQACTSSAQNVMEHFADVGKIREIGATGGKREIIDYKLSRYACYLIAQNADPSKEPVALAQTYFAIQTRKQELYEGFTEDQKRLFTRKKVRDHNKQLFETAQQSGVENFGRFNDEGYRGLYGLTRKGIQKKKKIGDDGVLDRAGATEQAANLFRITQTDEKLKSSIDDGKRVGEHRAVRTHFAVGGKVRKAMKDIGGTMPEELPVEEHIREVEKRAQGDKTLQAGKLLDD